MKTKTRGSPFQWRCRANTKRRSREIARRAIECAEAQPGLKTAFSPDIASARSPCGHSRQRRHERAPLARHENDSLLRRDTKRLAHAPRNIFGASVFRQLTSAGEAGLLHGVLRSRGSAKPFCALDVRLSWFSCLRKAQLSCRRERAQARRVDCVEMATQQAVRLENRRHFNAVSRRQARGRSRRFVFARRADQRMCFT